MSDWLYIKYLVRTGPLGRGAASGLVLYSDFSVQ